jgi:integrase
MARHRSTFGTVRQRSSGRWEASYWHDGTLHRAPVMFDSRDQAEDWLAEVRTEIRRGRWIDPDAGATPFREVANEWLAAGLDKRPSSVARDRAIIENHLAPVIGDQAIDSITKADVQALVRRWTDQKAASTVGRMYSCLRAILAFAVESDMIERTPCRGIRLPQATLVKRPSLTADQLDSLAAALGPDLAPFLWCGAELGLRWAEVAGVTVGCLDLLTGTLTVSAQLGRNGELAEPKSRDSHRTLSLSQSLREDLAGLLHRRGLTGADQDALVFVTEDGAPLNYSNWRQRTWLPACEAAALRGLRFHDLRSLSATELVRSGVDVKTTQRRLGHSSPKVTLDLYARFSTAADREAAETLATRLRTARTSRPIAPKTADVAEATENTPSDQEVCGRWATRTPDLSRVKAAL